MREEDRTDWELDIEIKNIKKEENTIDAASLLEATQPGPYAAHVAEDCKITITAPACATQMGIAHVYENKIAIAKLLVAAAALAERVIELEAEGELDIAHSLSCLQDWEDAEDELSEVKADRDRLREALKVIARNVDAGGVRISWCGEYAKRVIANVTGGTDR